MYGKVTVVILLKRQKAVSSVTVMVVNNEEHGIVSRIRSQFEAIIPRGEMARWLTVRDQFSDKDPLVSTSSQFFINQLNQSRNNKEQIRQLSQRLENVSDGIAALNASVRNFTVEQKQTRKEFNDRFDEIREMILENLQKSKQTN